MRTLQVFQVMFFALLAFDNCIAQGPGPQPVTCITVPVDTSCQAKFGDDPGDTPCSGNPCAWEAPDYKCEWWEPQEETRSLENWNGSYGESRYPDEDEQGVWGRLGMVQCVASRKCDCNMVELPDDIRCTLEGAETQKALKFFFYAQYVTEEVCWGSPQ